MTTDQAQAFIEEAEKVRDLRSSIQGLSQEEQTGIYFREWSPGRTLVHLWNTETGEEIIVPRYQALSAIQLPNSRGTGYMWTGSAANAPEPRKGSVKCFLHPQSPEREFLDEIGITAVCMSEHLASNPSKWAHARNRHPSAFASYQDEMDRRDQERRDNLQSQQTEAMLKLAGGRRRRGDDDGDG